MRIINNFCANIINYAKSAKSLCISTALFYDNERMVANELGAMDLQ